MSDRSSDVAAKVRAIIAEQNIEFLERADAIRAVWLCLLSAQHGYLMGPAGTAKSALLDSVARHIVGARYWHIQLDRMLDKADSFGQYDIARFETEKVWERDYTNTFGDCHIALLDEIDKAGPASLVPYLEMLQNRRFKPGKQWVDAPLISAFGAANTALAGEDGALRAIADRFLVRVPVRYLQVRDNFLALLSSAVVPLAASKPTTITLKELQHASRALVPTVTLPTDIAASIEALRTQLAAASIVCSDRRWKAAVWVLQANAWLAGRYEVNEDDLEVLRFVLWTRETDIPEVDRAVWACTSPYNQALVDCGRLIDEISTEVLLRRSSTASARKAYAHDAWLKLEATNLRLQELLLEAQGTGRDTAPVLALQDLLTSGRIAVRGLLSQRGTR